MSKRPILKKQSRRVRKALRPGAPVNMDLIHWLKSRRHASTTGEATRLLVEGKVRVDSHPVGRVEIPTMVGGEVDKRWVAQPIVSADLRPSLRVDA